MAYEIVSVAIDLRSGRVLYPLCKRLDHLPFLVRHLVSRYELLPWRRFVPLRVSDYIMSRTVYWL